MQSLLRQVTLMHYIHLKILRAEPPVRSFSELTHQPLCQTIDDRTYIFRSFLGRDKCITVIENYITKMKAEEARQLAKSKKVVKNAVKEVAKSSKASFNQIAEVSRSARTSFLAGISSVFKSPEPSPSTSTTEEEETSNK